MMASSPKRSSRRRYHNKHTKLSLLVRKIAPQLEIEDISPGAISRLSKFAHDLTRLEKKQISPKDELLKILEENNSDNSESETKEWLARHVIMNALTKDDEGNAMLCFSGLPIQFLFASNYLKETYEKNKNPSFFYEVIDDGTNYPGDELLYYLIELLDEKDVNDLMICFLNLLDINAKNYHVALAARIWKRCYYPYQEWWKNLNERIIELSAMPERKEEMVDPTSLPTLLKALNFLFGEGSKILEERMERRKTYEDSSGVAAPNNNGQEDSNAITTKNVALSEKINNRAWLSEERNLQNKFSILETYTKNYHLAKMKYAQWTSALAPPIVLHELEEAENNLIRTINEVQEILGNVYGRKFKLPYL